MAEHVQMPHTGNRVVRWASVVVFLATVAVIAAAVWPVVHDRLPFRAAAPVRPPAPSLRLTALRAKVAPTRTVAGASSLTMYAGSLWVTARAGRHPATLLRFSAHTLKPQSGTIPLTHAGTGPVHLAAGHGAIYVRTGAGIERAKGHALVGVQATSVPNPLLLSLYGVGAFGRAWTVQNHRLYAWKPGTAAARRVVTPFPPANVQPVVLQGKLWVGRAVKAGHPSLAEVQPVTAAGRVAGPSVRLGHGRVALELVAAHRLWVVVTRSGPRSWLDQVNPATGKLIGVTALPHQFVPAEGFADGRSVWLAENAKDGTVLRLSLTHPATS
jgi:hypothetical protein